MALRARTTAIWRDGGRDSSRGGPGDFGRGRRGFLRMGAALVAGLVLGDALGSSVAGASPSTRIARAALEGIRKRTLAPSFLKHYYQVSKLEVFDVFAPRWSCQTTQPPETQGRRCSRGSSQMTNSPGASRS